MNELLKASSVGNPSTGQSFVAAFLNRMTALFSPLLEAFPDVFRHPNLHKTKVARIPVDIQEVTLYFALGEWFEKFFPDQRGRRQPRIGEKVLILWRSDNLLAWCFSVMHLVDCKRGCPDQSCWSDSRRTI